MHIVDTGPQVVRYTALLTGVFYGIAHRGTLLMAHDEEVKHHAVREREHLIAQAKDAWKKKQESGKGGGEFSLFAAWNVLRQRTWLSPLLFLASLLYVHDAEFLLS